MKKIKTLVLIAAVLSFAGCATIKGAGQGLVEDAKSVTKLVPDIWGSLKKADQWFQEHAW